MSLEKKEYSLEDLKSALPRFKIPENFSIENFVEEYNDGKTISSLIKDFNISHSCLQKIVEILPLEKRQKKNKKNELSIMIANEKMMNIPICPHDCKFCVYYEQTLYGPSALREEIYNNVLSLKRVEKTSKKALI